MKFLKRIVYGVVVGTCLMMINHKCVKASPSLSNLQGSWFTNVSVNNGYNYALSNDEFYYTCLSGQECNEQNGVGYIIEPTITKNGFDYSYSGWEKIASKNLINWYDTTQVMGVINYLKSSSNKYATFIAPITYDSITNFKIDPTYFIRVDRDKFDFTVNNYIYTCGQQSSTYTSCFAIFSSGSLPSFDFSKSSSSSNRISVNSDTVIVLTYFDTNTNNLKYVFRRAYANEIYKYSYLSDWFINNYNNCINNNTCNYVSTSDFNFRYNNSVFGTLEGNAPPEDTFDIEWVKIDSTDDSDELYDNDNTVTSTNIGARFSPFDLTKYDYYLGFTTDSECSDNLEDYTKMTSSDKGVLTIANIKENGLVCAKITKVNTTNVIYTDTYEVDTVGKLSMFGFSNNKFSIFIDNLVNRLNYGGPISSLISIPLSLLSSIIISFNSSCSSYNLGSLLGHNIVFPCITIQSILGSTITNVIDLLASFTIYYHLILFIISIYRKIMNLEELDDYIPQQSKSISYDDLYW